jgi:hypothetical protein
MQSGMVARPVRILRTETMPNSFQFNYMCDQGDAATLHPVQVVMDISPARRTIRIEVWNGADKADITGDMVGDIAHIDHVAANRFPGGKAVAYFMINLFAKEVKRVSPSAGVMLGTPINRESIQKAEALQPGTTTAEQAAAHVYSQCGFDVSDPLAAVTSTVRVEDLIQATDAKISAWSPLPTP